MKVYLDYNATSPIRPEAEAAALAALRIGGNPSSVHAAGRTARAVVETAREQVAALAGARPQDVVFTSGGSEANTLAVLSARPSGCDRIIVGATEHVSVLDAAQAAGLRVEVWPVNRDGVADLAWLGEALKAGGRPFVALMLANNETGVIQPVAAAAELVRAAGGWLHVDAVQAAGRLPIDIAALGADSLALSGHKLGGPQGCGALVLRPGVEPARMTFGGGQERGRRGGTENLSGIAGFGAAAAASDPSANEQTRWRDACAAELASGGGVEVLGAGASRIGNTLCFAAPGYASELQVMGLDLAGVMVSSGAACSSGKVKASHVVTAMGRPDLASCSIRVSGGWASTEQDWIAFSQAWRLMHAHHAQRARALVEA